MNPAEWLRRTAALNPQAPALFCGHELVADYGEFARRAAAIAGGLAARGIAKGDRVAILMKNCTQYLETLYGIWWAGAAAVPINAKLHAREAAWILRDCEAALVIASPECADALARIEPHIALIVAQSPEFEQLYRAEGFGAPAPVDRDEMIWLFYTSGTTGRPKGVMITAQNILAMVSGYLESIACHDPRDATIYAAPMSHGAGLYNFLFVLGGARHVCPISGGFDAPECLALAAQIGRVTLFAAPTMVRRLVDHARASGATGEGLETLIYAGGPMYFADIVEATRVLGDRFAQIYGQGECPMAITVLPKAYVSDRAHPRWRERLRGVGYQQSVSQVRIVDDRGRELGPGETGEIVVAGPAVMKGYWRNPEATAAVLRDGWLGTGDLGEMDAEGFLTLHDRSKDMIISGGSNIYPREVEEVLLTHDSVAEAAVVGKPDPEWGEVVVACVVPATGCRLDASALDSLCLDRIARFKRPRHYVELSELPKNNYGKVVKTELRKQVAQIEL